MRLRPHLYGHGYSRQPSPRVTLAEVTFSLFLYKIQPTVYIRIANPSRGGARQLGWASCLALTGRVTLVRGTTFLQINALARLTGTILGVANVTLSLHLGFQPEIRIKKVKTRRTEPTVIE